MSDRRRRKATGLHSAQPLLGTYPSSVRMMLTRRARPSAGPAQPCRPPRVPARPRTDPDRVGARDRRNGRRPRGRRSDPCIASPTIATWSCFRPHSASTPRMIFGLRPRRPIDGRETCHPGRARRRSRAAPPRGSPTRRTTAGSADRRASSSRAPGTNGQASTSSSTSSEKRSPSRRSVCVVVGLAEDLGRDDGGTSRSAKLRCARGDRRRPAGRRQTAVGRRSS